MRLSDFIILTQTATIIVNVALFVWLIWRERKRTQAHTALLFLGERVFSEFARCDKMRAFGVHPWRSALRFPIASRDTYVVTICNEADFNLVESQR